ncbi:ZEB2-regulated ABC transporter 1-like [Teratosphaeria destructans]|uniref:ZEB2-regulated ABC transporter 1-like n=1 Tax=Teratosphaeria destructans TaxID=418781 RepID=A0A9W7SL40_9PEZI|nr:ZEB2-regulated ABC transporter 1-like [Teratosphaeria destructans]
MAAGTGIIRSASGRETYAPDGIISSETSRHPSHDDVDEKTPPEGYFDEKGQELIEEPSGAETSSSENDYILPEERENLRRLASHLSRTQSHYSRRTSVSANTGLERQDTLAGLELDDPALDPDSPKFDLHKFMRMTLKMMDEDGIKIQRAGVVMKDVNVRGSGSALNLQSTLGTMVTSPLRIGKALSFRHSESKHILRDFNALLRSGEMLVVLGRPGSGCSTFLKTIAGEHHGLDMDKASIVEYNGVSQQQMLKEFKGEVQYNQEVDKHFPHLTVGETLEHAAALRMPSHRVKDISRKDLVKHITKVVMAVYGLSHTYNTKVGNDFVRGVSGGERKRVSIAEMGLSGSAIACWDNSTRGLDSASALTFTQSLRQAANLAGSAHAVAIYQASQAIYDLFDKAVVLYEGREIYYGPAKDAKSFFERMGWYCPQRQTTGDFLTSITNPTERQAREGFEGKTPRTAADFEAYWRNSPEFANLRKEIEAYRQEYPAGHQGQVQAFRDTKQDQQAKHTRKKSPYIVSQPMQVKLNVKRAYQRTRNDMTATLTPVIGNIIMALIIGSVFYGTPNATAGFQSFGAVLFFAVLLNALSAIAEINSLYAQRPIVEKHKSYAFYHPWTEALAGVVLDIPIKFVQAVAFNVILYFMAGLRREPSQFFIFFLINFVSTFVMSAVFRTMAALTKTVSQAMALSGVLVLAIVVYTGFTVPIPYMHPWFSWIRYINPVFYAFEILIANQFHGRQFTCSAFVPAYTPLVGNSYVCSATGAVAGEYTVSGDTYIMAAYQYTYAHVWRNFGILLGFLFGFMTIYLIATELNSSTTSTAEMLVFRRGHVPAYLDPERKKGQDEEANGTEKTTEEDRNGKVDAIPEQTDIFTWKDVVYTIPIKDEKRRLLDNVSGYVKPGTLTALMGTSGAGKTTLLDALAQRTTMGVITGDMFVNGKSLDPSFQRKTGYVQQQDLHLETATVRESLRFSAMLRQPKNISKAEKYEYVEEVIKMLAMEDFAEAVVGVPGEGLNVEQRKLLTIGVELAAKPKLLLFLDEPTSGLDSQSSWAICAFLRKLADHGQAILCTIHQPSAILFQQFDRLLFLRKGGQTVYFGDIGKNSEKLLDYFHRNGARPCGDEENPAEYMLEIAGEKEQDWHETWKQSPEAQGVYKEIDSIHRDRQNVKEKEEDANAHSEFAMPFSTQLYEVTYRVFQQYWRMPSYILAKFLLSMASGLFIGFSFFNADNSLQGMQTVLYALFMVLSIFSTLVQQIMPLFVTQRSLYEVRERPSKAYSWKAFLIANIVVEWPYQIIAGILVYACFYYPVVGIQSSERQGLVLLLAIVFMIYASSFGHLAIAALPDAQTAGSIVTLLFAMTLIFNGVMQSPTALPGFWIFMYRVSPFTYWVGGMADAMLYGREITCSAAEVSAFDPPRGPDLRRLPARVPAHGRGHPAEPAGHVRLPVLQPAQRRPVPGGRQHRVGRPLAGLWPDVGLRGLQRRRAVVLYWFFRVRRSSGRKGVSLTGTIGAVVGGVGESLRNVYKTRARTNKYNREIL